MKISKKEKLRRQRISEGLKRHYKNLKRYEAIKKKRRVAVKGLETKFKKRMVGCVVVFDGQEYAFFDREHVTAQAIQQKLNLFPSKLYIIKLQIWLGIRTESAGIIIISGSGDSELTELVFHSHVTAEEFWTNYYATIRAYLEEHAPKGGMKYDSADIQLREIQVC